MIEDLKADLKEESNLQDYQSWQGNNDQLGAVKRKAELETAPVPIKKKKVSGPPKAKNAVQTLNEYKPGLYYVWLSV